MTENSLNISTTLSPEPAVVGVNETETVKTAVTGKCLNCGTEISDKFCPHCGQTTSVPERITGRNFGKSIALSFTRLTPGFLRTAMHLTYKPWEVVKDYIHGRQVGYSHPVTMIIQLALYSGFLLMIAAGLGYEETYIDFKYETDFWLLKMIKESTVMRLLWHAVPIAFATYLAYWKFGSRRFNISEYIIAVLYFIVAIRIYFFLAIPFERINIFGIDEADMDFLNLRKQLAIFIGLTLAFIGFNKAFPIQPFWKRVAVYVWWLGISLVCFFIYKEIFDIMESLIFNSPYEGIFS